MPTPAATLDDLAALNREMAALMRCGVPLPRGLRSVALGSGGGLAARLAERMEAGATLADAAAAEPAEVPPIWRAVVAAGVRSGRLPEALEALANLVDSMREKRRRLRLACIYPLIVAGLAYILLLGFIAFVVPRLEAMMASVELPAGRLLSLLDGLRSSLPIWGPAIPLGLLIVATICWGRSRASALEFDVGGPQWMPGMGAIGLNLQRGWFCRLLAALVERQVPLPESIELAADAVGGEELRASSAQFADSLRSGRSLAESLPDNRVYTPVVRWAMASGAASHELPAALHRISDVFLDRAHRQSEWLQLLAPVATTVFIGGGMVLLYGLSVFGPLVELFDRLAVEPFL